MRGSSVTSQGEVCGHFVEQTPKSWQPLPQESTEFFRAVVNNEDAGVAALLDENPELLNAQLTLLYWGADPKTAVAEVETGVKTSVSVRHRTPLMLAAQCSSVDVMLLLLDRGADVHAKALEDGQTAMQVAMNSDTSSSAVLDVLKEAANSTPVKPSKQPAESSAFFGVHQGQEMNGDVSNPEGFPYSTAELRLPEYTDDDFRMFSFKIARCNKKYTHDWRSCPFAHPTENARRRDPREFRYCSIACPDYKQGFCIRGDACEFAHGVFEGWLHPARYRTQLCKDGANCHRPVCFFAHCLPELRTPTCTWTPDPDTLNAAGVVAPRSFVPPAAHQPSTENLVNSSIKSNLSANLSASPTSAVAYEELEMSGFLEIADEARPRLPPDSPINLPGNSSYGGASTSDASVASGYAAHHMQPMQPMQPTGQAQESRQASRPRPNTSTAAPKREVLTGFTTPRMSNSFARRHGLNPKDNAMLNLQKLAIQTQVARPPPPQPPRYAEDMQTPWVYGKQGYRAMGQMSGGRQPPQWQNAGPPAGPAMPHGLPVHMYGMQHMPYSSGLAHGMMPGMHAGGPVDASSVTALNHSLLALGLQHNQHPLSANAMNLGAFNSGMPLSEAYPNYHGGGTQA